MPISLKKKKRILYHKEIILRLKKKKIFTMLDKVSVTMLPRGDGASCPFPVNVHYRTRMLSSA